MLSVVIPAFNEHENISNTASVISKILDAEDIAFEIIFVDDGSSDGTWGEICTLAGCNRARGVRFSRNFGKESAIFAGLSAARGECAVVIDCDLQHPPELIPKMYRLWQGGAEVVEAVKTSRGKESLLYKLFAKSFYRLMKAASGIDLNGASDYRLLDRKVIDALCELPERVTFFRALSGWVGFNTEKVEFEVQPRSAGKSKWSFKKLFVFAVNSVTSFTSFPLQIITFVGVVFGIFALILGVQTLVKYFSGKSAEGFSTVILLLLITGACVMVGIGIIGLYLSKIYEEVRQRPRYIVAERTEPPEGGNANEKSGG